MSNKNYKESELREESLRYFQGDLLATNIWIKKYALKINGKFTEKNPDETIRRLTDEIFRAESMFKNPLTWKEIYKNLKGFKNFIFGGSILFGLGNPLNVSLANCFFVNNNADSYGGIFQTDESIAQLMKRRGGVGITLEHLRPEGSVVGNSAQNSTGAISFMKRFSNTTREVAQDGRRGALMISCDVRHNNIKDFIKIKEDTSKITGANISVKMTDDFMKAVENDQDYYLRWPVNKVLPKIDVQIAYNELYEIEKNVYITKVRAKEIWDLIIEMAHKNAEPGILFWDQIIKESPADAYKDFGFETQGVNPCVVGETLIAVADGRGEVRIDQLTKEGKDIPVYSLNNESKIEIQMMVNPRITGYNQKIYKINLDSGDSIRVTGNHKIRMKDGSYKEAKNLKYGDSMYVSYFGYSPIVRSSNKNRKRDYKWVKNSGGVKGKAEHTMIYEFYHKRKIPRGYVIHHKDYNTLNNSIDNLQMMTKEEHDEFHKKNMIGDKNPYHRMSDEWKRNFKLKAIHPGKTNGRYTGISNLKLYREIIKKTKKAGRKISGEEWKNHAQHINNKNKKSKPYFPQNISHKFRGGGNYLLERAASYLELEYINKDPRLVRTYFKAIANGYESKIGNHEVLIKKYCEECGNEFWREYTNREVSFCNTTCSNNYFYRTTDFNTKRSASINKTYAIKGEFNKENQLRIYSQLKFDLKRDPLVAEWREQCKKEDIPCRIGTKNGYRKWTDIKKLGVEYNHKVIGVEEDGFETVYNGTVDKNHNFFNLLKPFNELEHHKQFITNTLNCGEIGLSNQDSCRLGSINIFSMVKNPFTKDVKFDWSKLAKISKFAQRVMDDIVELEEEKIIGIINKIKKDPEDDSVKNFEMTLWESIGKSLKKGRRTGVGLLGLADSMAGLGIKYGTKEATKFAEKVQKTIAVNSYKESVKLAKERGPFPIWNAEIEVGNPFLTRIISNEFNNEEYEEYLKYGRRNIANLTIPPTGSLGILGQVSSGLEPVFKIFYKRRRKINPHEKNIEISFVDQNGDSWEEYNVIHYPFIHWYHEHQILENSSFENTIEYLKNLKEEDFDKLIAISPWSGSESHAIDYLEKVNMQGKIQKWIDHSISATLNLPEDISIKEINDIYFHAWKVGCKGMTIYRDKSRTGVLLTGKEKISEEFEEHNAPKRPKDLEADYYVATSKGIKFAVIIGLLKGKPYEIFAFENPPSLKNAKGITTKIGKGHYKFVNGEFEIDKIDLAAEREHERTVTLMASSLLRHGAPIKFINKTIKKIDENITSFSSVVRRYLSRYIESELNDGESCPECGEKLIMEGGCVHCVTCSYDKCL